MPPGSQTTPAAVWDDGLKKMRDGSLKKLGMTVKKLKMTPSKKQSAITSV
jgi:hypothetical protein